MKKISAYILIIALLLSGSGISAFAIDYDEVQPFVGGGDSHFYQYTSRSTTLSRSTLETFRQDLAKSADSTGKVILAIQLLASKIHFLLGLAAGTLENVAAENEELIRNALNSNPRARSFKIYYREYTCEIPDVGYIKITKVESL